MAKKRKSRKSPNSNNSTITLVLIIIVLAIISIVTAYFMLDEEEKPLQDLIENLSQTNSTENKTANTLENKITSPIDGTWVSNYDGAMLTISGTTFSIEMPSVDASSKVMGTIAIEETIVSFTNNTGNNACIGKEGHYNYSFINDELMLNKIKDPCDSRSQRMSTSWFKF